MVLDIQGVPVSHSNMDTDCPEIPYDMAVTFSKVFRVQVWELAQKYDIELGLSLIHI